MSGTRFVCLLAAQLRSLEVANPSSSGASPPGVRDTRRVDGASLTFHSKALAARTFETTLPMQRGARTVRITARGKMLHVEAAAGTVGAQARNALTQTVARIFRLDEDLSHFYTLVSRGRRPFVVRRRRWTHAEFPDSF